MKAHPSDDLYVLSGGAAQGLVVALAPQFHADTGISLHTTFGAVGAMREKLLAGERCDVLIVTEAMIDELAPAGRVDGTTRRAVGRVPTGIGIRAGDASPDIDSRAALERTLRSATEIFLPDPQRATAGIHFVQVLATLDVHADVASRLRPYPNGAAAMHALARSETSKPIGCTQVSEIVYAAGVTLVGPLPPEFALTTTYSIALSANTLRNELARRFVELLCAPEADHIRRKAGFES